ncbi:polyprenyl synthetase family protein [Rhodopila globiformis]|uniref:Phosphoesterase n=1 Tax=Rhodopila globiformis TaxID=1071 RepID=A0A2S6MW70_RHOGL|nr:polyprenyl synthetase family protein [Rhodopila globiformis]PPQ26602.1 phosphoesterase [Rhodopila globiformis]
MDHVVAPDVVRETLAEYGAMTRAAMQAYFPAAEPGPHLYDLLADYPRRGGKMMRSSLCIATARVFGASIDDALLSAVAIELMHNALLIHDDIEDESEQRRDSPTLHALHGIPLALNTGDALALLSMRPLFDNFGRIGPRLALSIVRETERMAWESAEGQAMELGWRRDNCHNLTDADYLTMVLKKTCWLASIHPGRIGAMIGTRDSIDLEPFIRFGFFLGAAFQIQDDLLNLVPDETYGKEPNGDIFEGKRTLMLNHVYRLSPPPQRRILAELLDSARAVRTAEQVAWIRALMEEYGSIAYARGIAHGLAGAALHEYARIFDCLPDSRDRQFIRGLTHWIFHRA